MMNGEVEKKPHILPSTLRMVAWEVTRRCNLACVHCRASSLAGPYPGELDTTACLKLIDDMAAFSQPVIILTGGGTSAAGGYFRDRRVRGPKRAPHGHGDEWDPVNGRDGPAAA